MEGAIRSNLLRPPALPGNDVDFGALCPAYLPPLWQSGAFELRYGTQVENLKRLRRGDMTEGDWRVILKARRLARCAPVWFLGAGGGACRCCNARSRRISRCR